VQAWRKCSSCKAGIGFSTQHWLCSVSTCNRKRTGFFFCSVGCWEMHLPTMRHREAWAVEKHGPTAEEWEHQQAQEASEPSTPVSQSSTSVSKSQPHTAAAAVRTRVAAPAATADDDLPRDILIVVSKLKKYIKARSGMNTSDTAMPVFSDYVRKLADMAIRNAGEDGRRTVLDRDLKGLM